ncbi:hypothetical protein ABZ137_28185 [Streptomyces bobili]|uniref:hypothetical protein n=1 Tax=Streptomyces bobili TaxID=67280 RepID=UPI0033A8A26D
MRGLPVRRIASTALCATFVLGIATPAALAVDGDATRDRTRAVPSAPLTGADTLLARARTLDRVQPLLTPVTDLLDTSLKPDGGRLDADRARRLGVAAEEALTEVTKAVAPTGTPPRAGTGARARAADTADDVLAAVQKQVDALLAAATSGDLSQILPTATSLVTGLSDLVTSLVDGLSLPALEDLLPEAPTLPTTPALPVETPALPDSTPELPVTLPAAATELPLTPVPVG